MHKSPLNPNSPNTLAEEIAKSENEFNEFTENIIDTVREPLIVIDKDLRVIKASHSFYNFFKVTAAETIGKLIYELGNHQWDIPKLKELLEKIIPEKNSFENYEVEHNFSTIGKRVMLLNARQVKRAFGKEKIILLAIEDITERKSKEDCLKETHRATSDSLNILLDLMQTPIIIWDTSMIIKRFNSKFEQLSGYDSAEVIGRKIDFLFPKEKIAATLELLKNHPGEEQEAIEIDILTKDNNIKTVLWISSRILDEAGNNIIATISQDITSRRQSELALRNSESHLRTLVQTIPDMIWLKDSEGVYLSCNTRFERFFGAREADIIGKTDYDFVDRDLADLFRTNDRNAIAAGKPTSNEEYVTFAEDGHSEIVETIKTPMYDFNGKLIGVLGIGRDSTQRKLAEQKVQASEKRFRAIFDQAPVAIALLDMQGHPIISNLRLTKMIGYSSDELAKMMFTEFTYSEDIYKDLKQFTDLIAGKITGYSMEKRYIHKNGNIIWANLFVTTLNDNNGLPQEIIGMVEDITERKQAEEKLKNSEEKFKIIFDYAPDAYYLTDLNGTFIDANIAVVKMLGFNKNELIGKDFFKLKLISPNQILKATALLATNLLGTATGPDEFVLNQKNGSKITVEIRAYPVKIQDQSIVLGIARDVTRRKQAEKEITMLAHSLKSISECVSITDMDNKILFVNESFLKTYGFELNELIGENISKVRSQSYKPGQFDEILPATIKGEWQGELMNRKKDGTEFPVYLSTTLIKVEENEVLGLIGVASDITERRKTQNELKFQAHLLNNVGQAVIATDLLGKVIYWNNAAEKIYGWSTSEAIGQNIMDLTPARQTNEQAIEIMKELSAGKTWAGEFYVKRKDGSSFPAFVTDTPILDSNGKLIGIIGISSDITERKQTQQKIKESEEKFRIITENSADAIFITDKEGKYIYVNKQAVDLFGYSKEELLKFTIADISPKNRIEEYFQIIKQLKIAGTSYSEIELVKKDGSYAETDLNAVLLPNGWIYGSCRDISERKKLENELIKAKERAEESDRLKTAFLDNISHEIRTPMNGILGFTELIRTAGLTGEEQQKFIVHIENSGIRLLNLLNDIISFSIIQSQQTKISVSETNVNEQVEHIYHSFKLAAEQKELHISFKNELTLDKAFISTDHEKVFAVLTNLVKNAIKFTQTGSVELGYTMKGDFVEFYVKDSGSGISDVQKKFIFERFRQGSDALTRDYEGAGLGLAISKAYVEMLGGKIWVENNAGRYGYERGSTFFFTIPCLPAFERELL